MQRLLIDVTKAVFKTFPSIEMIVMDAASELYDESLTERLAASHRTASAVSDRNEVEHDVGVEPDCE